MKYLYLILLICIFTACTSTEQTEISSPLTGKWIYRDCSIKNTSVRGTITFRTDGTFELDADARDDYPVGSIRGIYSYKVSGSMILTEYTRGYGISLYYYIDGDELFFSDIQPGSSGEGAMWDYRLLRSR